MHFFLQPRVRGPARKRVVKPFWLASLGWFAACIGSVTMAAASMPQAAPADDLASAAPVTRLLPAARPLVTAGPRNADVQSTARCKTCGVVEIVRTLHGTAAAPGGYELTVRFRDGTRRVSNHSDDAGWRAGDSIMLIGGAKTAQRT